MERSDILQQLEQLKMELSCCEDDIHDCEREIEHMRIEISKYTYKIQILEGGCERVLS